jgi:type II secretory pathway pseudopilin PulG
MRNGTDRGITLLEVAIMLAVLAILASAVTPAVMQRIVDARVDATRSEVKNLYEAMVGRESEQGTFGFVGDMGRLPTSLDELVRPGNLPAYTAQTVRNVGIGWNGPYINAGVSQDDYLVDGFGRPYAPIQNGQVRSFGADSVLSTPDDIVYPPNPPLVNGRVAVVVKHQNEDGSVLVDPSGYVVNLYYSNNGRQAVLTAVTPPVVFENVPRGLHAVVVIGAGTIVAQDTIASLGGGQTRLVDLWVLRPTSLLPSGGGDEGAGQGSGQGRGSVSGQGRGAGQGRGNGRGQGSGGQ